MKENEISVIKDIRWNFGAIPQFMNIVCGLEDNAMIISNSIFQKLADSWAILLSMSTFHSRNFPTKKKRIYFSKTFMESLIRLYSLIFDFPCQSKTNWVNHSPFYAKLTEIFLLTFIAAYKYLKVQSTVECSSEFALIGRKEAFLAGTAKCRCAWNIKHTTARIPKPKMLIRCTTHIYRCTNTNAGKTE